MQQIQSQLEKLLHDELRIETGAAYLVPKQWWQELTFFNFDIQSVADIEFPSLSLPSHVDTFLLDFQDGILEELEHNRTTFSPQIKKEFQWKIVSPAFWKRIPQTVKPSFCLLTHYDSENPSACFKESSIQFQIVFCSRVKSEAFVGFLPQNCEAISAVRSIGYELGFIEMENSKIVFPEKNAEKLYQFHQLEKKKIGELPDTLLMAFNLQIEQENHNQKDYSFGKQDLMIDSNEAVAGQLNITPKSWQHLQNDGTMSTGAETPSFIFTEEHNRDVRLRQLFREKKPEEIKHMKDLSQKCIYGELIPVRNLPEEQLELQLEGMALELLECINHQKKKSLKQKDHHE